jgi:DNA-binding response OmpR family regulator
MAEPAASEPAERSESDIVDRHVRALRAKLHSDWHKPRYIATVAGTEYQFVPADPKDH